MKILIIEDHPKIRENINSYFKFKWYVVEDSFDWEKGLEKALIWNFDVIILDINLPIMNGKEFLYKLREKNNNTPVIALTSNNTLDDKVEVYDLWVDDYLTKPFELKELEIRILALSKRKDKLINDVLIYKDIELNITNHTILKESKKIDLWNKEYLIIEFLLLNKWYPKSKWQIFEKVWWESEELLDLNSTTLESHISTIRKKLWKDFIKTIKWVGYIIE